MMMMTEKPSDDDPWELLGVQRNAAQVEIKFAFRKLAMEYHPDKQPNDVERQAAHDIFQKIKQAYDIIMMTKDDDGDDNDRVVNGNDESKEEAAVVTTPSCSPPADRQNHQTKNNTQIRTLNPPQSHPQPIIDGSSHHHPHQGRRGSALGSSSHHHSPTSRRGSALGTSAIPQTTRPPRRASCHGAITPNRHPQAMMSRRGSAAHGGTASTTAAMVPPPIRPHNGQELDGSSPSHHRPQAMNRRGSAHGTTTMPSLRPHNGQAMDGSSSHPQAMSRRGSAHSAMPPTSPRKNGQKGMDGSSQHQAIRRGSTTHGSVVTPQAIEQSSVSRRGSAHGAVAHYPDSSPSTPQGPHLAPLSPLRRGPRRGSAHGAVYHPDSSSPSTPQGPNAAPVSPLRRGPPPQTQSTNAAPGSPLRCGPPPRGAPPGSPTRRGPPPGCRSPRHYPHPNNGAPPLSPTKVPRLPPTGIDGQQQPVQVLLFRDPFETFHKLAKEQFGKAYKADSWQYCGLADITKLGSTIHAYSKKSERASKEFKKLTSNKTLSNNELSQYITKHPNLWTNLGVLLGLPDQKCIEFATHVACAVAMKRETTMSAVPEDTITEKDFKFFHQKYVMDEKGATEFFLRTIFSSFDTDRKGFWGRHQLGFFLNTFYKSRTLFKDSDRLPDPKSLNQIVLEHCRDKSQVALYYPEVRDLLIIAAIVMARDAHLQTG